MNTRRHTKFQLCSKHEWLNQESRRRRAEFLAEGGPTDGLCVSGRCRMWAGIDLFIPEVCTGEYPLAWTTGVAG